MSFSCCVMLLLRRLTPLFCADLCHQFDFLWLFRAVLCHFCTGSFQFCDVLYNYCAVSCSCLWHLHCFMVRFYTFRTTFMVCDACCVLFYVTVALIRPLSRCFNLLLWGVKQFLCFYSTFVLLCSLVPLSCCFRFFSNSFMPLLRSPTTLFGCFIPQKAALYHFCEVLCHFCAVWCYFCVKFCHFCVILYDFYDVLYKFCVILCHLCAVSILFYTTLCYSVPFLCYLMLLLCYFILFSRCFTPFLCYV